MKYTMTKPCDECPFLNTPNMKRGFSVRRLKEFADEGQFPCHQTASADNDEGEFNCINEKQIGGKDPNQQSWLAGEDFILPMTFKELLGFLFILFASGLLLGHLVTAWFFIFHSG